MYYTPQDLQVSFKFKNLKPFTITEKLLRKADKLHEVTDLITKYRKQYQFEAFSQSLFIVLMVARLVESGK